MRARHTTARTREEAPLSQNRVQIKFMARAVLLPTAWIRRGDKSDLQEHNNKDPFANFISFGKLNRILRMS